MAELDGTQIGADGRRYDIEDLPESTPEDRVAAVFRVHGTPSLGDVVWFNPTTERAEWADIDTVSAYTPSGELTPLRAERP